MNHIRFFKDISKIDIAIAGGKGASLGEMSGGGIPVPPGFVILANAFDRFIEETNLKEEIAARLAEVNPEDTNTVDRASNVLRDVIHDTPMPKDLGEEVLASFDELFAPTTPSRMSRETPPRAGGDRFVAVRSSATAEDSSVASWAGELETYLNTTRESVLNRVKECWSSLYTPRAIFYRHEKNLIDSHVSVAVVVQKMVQSEISGVAFTVHPVTEDPDQMIIEAGYGLGEAIVSGAITPDSYVVSKSQMMIQDVIIGGQTKKLVRKKMKDIKEIKDITDIADSTKDNSTNEWIQLTDEESGKQKLTGRQIVALAELCKKIEAHYGFPCDIEWAFENGTFYITQSRPITTLAKK